MYKGNLYEFIDKLNIYCSKTFEIGCYLSAAGASFGGTYTLVFYLNKSTGAYWLEVSDAGDFEEQCYEGVKTALKHLKMTWTKQ